MPAPMRMPISAAYDSIVPRSRRRMWDMLGNDNLLACPAYRATHMRRRTKILIGIAVLLVAVVAFGVVRSRRGKDVTSVTMAKVSRQDLTSKVSANGKIDAKRKVDL